MFRAASALTSGQHEAASEHLDRAERAFAEADMEVHAAVARLRLGEITGSARGAELVAEGTSRLAAQGVKSPPKVARMLAPGQWRR